MVNLSIRTEPVVGDIPQSPAGRLSNAAGAPGIFLLSVTHNTAPLAVRERLALDESGLVDLLDDLSDVAGEAAAIVTCNRTEVYGLARDWESVAGARSILAMHAGLNTDELTRHVLELHGEAVVRHLFRVASGLDSIVIGEPQILGQVREAAEIARLAGRSGPILSRLFNFAVVAGKRARHETSISRGAGSVSQAAVELGRDILGNLQHRRCLVVGLGDMGQLVARNLAAHGVRDLDVCNRTAARAASVARDLGARVVPWDGLERSLVDADIVITATGAHEPILTGQTLRPVMARRQGRHLLLIDIAVPRDVEPAAASIDGLHLYDMDALHDIRAGNLRAREETVPQVEAIVDEQVRAFQDWCRARASVPAIRMLRDHVESIREREFEKALRRLGHLDERDREVVRALSHALANSFLHTPVERLKASAIEGQGDSTDALADLFALEQDARRKEE